MGTEADLDRACEHPDFLADVEVGRLTQEEGGAVVAFKAVIHVWCVACNESFRFTGVGAGDLPDRPTCSPDETELRVPIRPASSDPDFGMGLPGFSIGYRGSA